MAALARRERSGDLSSSEVHGGRSRVLVLICGALAVVICCGPPQANKVTVSDLRVILDSTRVRSLITSEGERDRTNPGQVEWHPDVSQLREPYPGLGQTAFLLSLANEPSVLLPKDTYVQVLIWESGVRCFSDRTSTARLQEIRVVSGPLRGQEGWTCGPLRPVLDVP